MRYILDNEGYVELCSRTPMQCGGRGCTEYTGSIPSGYSTIEEWANTANIRAYKIVDGNLVFDANRDYKLRILFDDEAYTNGYVSRKEMGIASTDEINPYTDLYPSQQSAGGYITGLDGTYSKVGNLPTEEVNLILLETQDIDLIELEFVGNNLLPNTATSAGNNGITYTQNKDKTIDVKGTARDRSSLNLAGTDTSVRNVLTFKGTSEGYDESGNTVLVPTYYLLSDLPNGVSIEFYHYDGSNRTLVGSYNGGVISFEEDANVTQVVLVVENGTTINETIKPMLSLTSSNNPSEYDIPEYEEYKNNTTLIDLGENTFEDTDKIVIKDNQIVLIKKGALEEIEDESGNVIAIGKEEIYLGDTVMPRTYTPYTHAYCHQKVFIDFKYRDSRNVDITKITLEGLLSITNIETEYNFGLEDAEKVLAYVNGEEYLTDEELEVYDINADGVVDKLDSLAILRMYYGYIPNTVRGTLEINSTKAQRTIVLRDEEGKISTSLGLNGITTPSLSVCGNKVYGEKVLYTGDSREAIILNDDAANYEYIEIFYHADGEDSGYSNTKVHSPDGKNATLISTVINTSGKYVGVFERLTIVSISGNTITPIKYGQLSATSSAVDTNFIYITRVVGYQSDIITQLEEPEEPEEDIVEVNKTSTITGSTNSSYWTFKTVVKEESINKTDKTSVVTLENYLGRKSTAGSSYFMGTLTTTYNCGGQTYSETMYRNSGTVDAGGWYKLGSHTFTVEHTTEPMNINVSGSMSTNDFSPSSASASGTVTLTEI